MKNSILISKCGECSEAAPAFCESCESVFCLTHAETHDCDNKSEPQFFDDESELPFFDDEKVVGHHIEAHTFDGPPGRKVFAEIISKGHLAQFPVTTIIDYAFDDLLRTKMFPIGLHRGSNLVGVAGLVHAFARNATFTSFKRFHMQSMTNGIEIGARQYFVAQFEIDEHRQAHALIVESVHEAAGPFW